MTSQTFRPKKWDRNAVIRRLMSSRLVSLSGCWEWTGLIDADGYGVVTIAKKTNRVHRIAAHTYLEMDIKSPLKVCHTCDNRKCFNPDHLFLGSASDNAKDAARKGHLLGSRNANAILREGDVLEIRKMLDAGVPSVRIAEQFGVTKYCISDIKRRKRWKHLMAAEGCGEFQK